MTHLTIWKDLRTQEESYELPEEVCGMCLKYILFSSSLLEFPSMVPTSIISIKTVVCNSDLTMALTTSGTLLGWGTDNYGLLGPELLQISSPIQIQNLYLISKVAISETHAAAIDENGCLFTWGTDKFGKLGLSASSKWRPEQVPSSRAFKSSEVVCGDTFTCILSDGGFIHFYGRLGCGHRSIKSRDHFKLLNNYRSYSHPELDNYSVVALQGNNHFISVLTDLGEVYVLDECMDLVCLPFVTGEKIEKISANFSQVWGISGKKIISWGKLRNEHKSFNCELSIWDAEVREISHNEKFRVFSIFDKFAVTSEISNVFCGQITKIKHYKRYDFTTQKYEKAMESPRISMVRENRILLESFEDLNRLFPDNDDEKTVKEIIKCRVEYGRREILCKAFSGMLYPDLKIVFEKIKEYSWMIKIYKGTLSISTLFANLNTAYKKQLKWGFLQINNLLCRKAHDFQFSIQKCVNSKVLSYQTIFFQSLKNFVFFSVLKIFVNKTLKATLQSLISFDSTPFLQSLTCFSIIITNILSKRNYKSLMFWWNAFKARLIFASKNRESPISITYFDEETSIEIRKNAKYKKELTPIIVSSLDSDLKYQGSLSSRNQRDQYSISKNNLLSPSFSYLDHTYNHSHIKPNSPNSKSTHYFDYEKSQIKADMKSFQDYLIKQKIKERQKKDCPKEAPLSDRPVSKNFFSSRPPWRPASISSNFNSLSQKESAIKKGNEYYLKLREKASKFKVMDQLDESQQTYIAHEDRSLIQKSPGHFSPNSLSTISSSQMLIDQKLLNYGLGSMVLNRASAKILKNLQKTSFEMIKKFEKSYILPPVDPPKVSKETLGLIRSSWQYGVILIATEKLQNIFRQRHNQLFFNCLTNFVA